MRTLLELVTAQHGTAFWCQLLVQLSSIPQVALQQVHWGLTTMQYSHLSPRNTQLELVFVVLLEDNVPLK